MKLEVLPTEIFLSQITKNVKLFFFLNIDVSKIFRCHNKLTLADIAKTICLKLNMKPSKYFEKIKLWIKENDNSLIELDKKESLKNINTIFWKNSTGLRLYDTDDFFKGVLDKNSLLDNTNRVLYYSLDFNGLL